jgi:vitamin B12 transporter
MKNLVFPKCSIARARILLCLSFLGSSFAQGQEINPVVVVSSRVEELLSEALPSVSVIQKSELEKFRYADLYEVLSGQAGLQLARTGGPGNPTTVFSRGANSTQTLILVDGIPFAAQGAIGSISPLESIPIAQVERIEILRGNASAIFGPGAAGGVIQITTLSPSSASDGGTIKVDAGSQNTRSVQASLLKNIGDGQLSISMSDDRSDGISTFTPANYINVPNVNINPDRNGVESKGYGLGWRYKVSADTNLAFHYLSSSTLASYDNPYASTINERWASQSKLEMMGAQASHRVTAQWKSTLSYGQSVSKLSTLTNDSFNPDYGTTNSHQRQIKWDNLLILNDSTQATVGYAHQESKLDAQRTSYDWNVFPAEPFDVLVRKSVRQERIYAGLNQRQGLFSWRVNLSHEKLPGGHSGNTYLLGAGFDLNSNYKITLTRSNAIQSPTVGQLHDVAYGGNVKLQPEHSASTELELQFKDENSFWRLVAFDVRYKDMIVASKNPVADPFWADQFVTQLENLSSTRNQGAELSYGRKWASWGVQLSYTHQNPVNLNSERPLQNRSKRFGALTVSHFLNERTILNAKILATSSRWTPRIGSFGESAQVAGYGVLNLSAEHKILKDLKASFNVLNALDKSYQHLNGYDNPGRTFHIGLKYTFH